ncbi:hypothetical protein SAMN04490185_2872 [Pseudomonas frederiksbergensis]|uniref:Uncharacterized protein n=1 Tax=Pseudomonas frederiksbergensis TaxID=104087 RepID=A0A1H4YBM0_9PSED|nr:hypothetical protein [Pseudomonas frederiksbergensis]SED15115.1 hypothetical protein SAMN04490185_2872 [Pseudomonas frederiksbergensis]
MQLHEAVELKEAYSVSNANTAIQEGWKLLAVAPGANGVTYVLGKPKEVAQMLHNSPRHDAPRR